jgi:hypothetical protein
MSAATPPAGRAESGKPRHVAVPEAPHDFAPSTPQTVAQRRKAQADEYSVWEATVLIREPTTGVPMFEPTARIPKSTVAAYPDVFVEGENIRRVPAPQEG